MWDSSVLFIFGHKQGMGDYNIQMNIIHTIDEQEKSLENFKRILWDFGDFENSGMGRDFVKEGHCN